MISLIFAAIIPIAHIWETNSTPTVRRFYAYSANSYKLIQTPNYVTNGLTHWYDGQVNVGIGRHEDGDIAFWKDLSGTNDLLITSTNVFFTKKGLRCPYYLPIGASQFTVRPSGLARGSRIPDDECVTIEVCARSRVYIGSAYMSADLRTDMFNALVSNGRRYASNQSSFPQFIAFHSQFGTTKRYSGGPLFVIGGRAQDLRCLSFDNDYSLWGDGSMKIYDTFSLMFCNQNVNETSPSIPYYQAYWSAKFDYTRFAPSFENCITTHEDGAPEYSINGQRSSTSLLKPDPNFEYFSIGGSCYYEDKFGMRTYYDTNFWHGDIFCVRTYNRELTAEERAQNAKIDYERFYDAD